MAEILNEKMDTTITLVDGGWLKTDLIDQIAEALSIDFREVVLERYSKPSDTIYALCDRISKLDCKLEQVSEWLRIIDLFPSTINQWGDCIESEECIDLAVYTAINESWLVKDAVRELIKKRNSDKNSTEWRGVVEGGKCTLNIKKLKNSNSYAVVFSNLDNQGNTRVLKLSVRRLSTLCRQMEEWGFDEHQVREVMRYLP
ncbi:hypothetical protein BI308_25870 [Roseofilum reptotaenium AO1-A]|uniref:Uncharacterized protein n=1 Tax=Roseofilum reptotaenium AO1-A TaxID=1925591 RepID=A0A1L9QC73_9CYAN|nr:hypothetical protein BI308_25870 [Roseofilum reptotaenium AO1-A]